MFREETSQVGLSAVRVGEVACVSSLLEGVHL